ncbi:MAG: hypothetical protein WCI93_00560 [bacterium]
MGTFDNMIGKLMNKKVSPEGLKTEKVYSPEEQAIIDENKKLQNEFMAKLTELENGAVEKLEPSNLAKVNEFLVKNQKLIFGLIAIAGAGAAADSLVNHNWESINMDLGVTLQGLKLWAGAVTAILSTAAAASFGNKAPVQEKVNS